MGLIQSTVSLLASEDGSKDDVRRTIYEGKDKIKKTIIEEIPGKKVVLLHRW